MKHSQLLFGVLVLVLIVNCGAKNVQLEHSDFSPTGDSLHFNDDGNYNSTNFDETHYTTDGIGSGDRTLPTSDVETKDGFQESDNGAEAPDIKITINGSKETNQAVALVCEARGVPAEINFLPWVHMWGDRVIREGLHGRIHGHINELLIYNLSLQEMGTYICLGESGFKGTHDKKPRTASENLKITGVPTILRENTIFHGKIGQLVNISIPFYSDPAVEIFFIQTNGTSDISTYLVNESIDYLMYGKAVKLEAHILKLVILNSSQEDFKNYTLSLKNRIGLKKFIFQLVMFEDKENQATMMRLFFAGLAALVVVYIGLTVTVFKIKRRKSSHGICRKQGKQSRERRELGIEMNPANVCSVPGSEVTGEQEDITAKTTYDNYYSDISDVRVDHTASQAIRPAENFAYDKVHTYANSQDRTYSSLNPMKGGQGVTKSFQRKRQRQTSMRLIREKITQTFSEL